MQLFVIIRSYGRIYSNDLAKRVARAVKNQGGKVVEFNLNPPAIEMFSHEQLVDLSQACHRSIAEAGVLFFTGYREELEVFEAALRPIVENALFEPPLVVLYESDTPFELRSMVSPLTRLEGGDTGLGSFPMGHYADFFLHSIARKTGYMRRG